MAMSQCIIVMVQRSILMYLTTFDDTIANCPMQHCDSTVKQCDISWGQCDVTVEFMTSQCSIVLTKLNCKGTMQNYDVYMQNCDDAVSHYNTKQCYNAEL